MPAPHALAPQGLRRLSLTYEMPPERFYYASRQNLFENLFDEAIAPLKALPQAFAPE